MKRMTRHASWFVIASLLLSIAAPNGAPAQSDYPNKPVRIINDSAAGSANDASSLSD
jgi:hypothetical protein